MPQTQKRRRRPAGRTAAQRPQSRPDRRTPPRTADAPPPRRPVQPGQPGRVEDSFFYEHPPRRRDNTVPFPGGSGGQQGRGAQRPRPQNRAAAARPARRPPTEARRRHKDTHQMLRRHRMLRRLTAALLVVCVAAVGIYLTVTMLFKINAIQVAGPDGAALTEAGPYTAGEILDALGVQVEENIFSFDPDAKAAMLEKRFPLLEQIRVDRIYPSTVVVRVTPAAPAYAMQTGTGWLSLSAGLKILSLSGEQPDLPVLWGGEPVSAVPGDQLAYALPPAADSAASAPEGQEDSRLEALKTLLAALDARGLLADVTRIEYADAEEVAFLYQDRISVWLGTLNELDYKLDYAEYMLLNKEGKGCAETDTGRLDCSHVRTDGSLQAIFAQGAPALPSGYTLPQPEPAPDAQTEPDAASAAEAGAEPAEQAGLTEEEPNA